MEERYAISIVGQATSEMDFPALPGRPLTLKAFKDWVASAEAAPSVSLRQHNPYWQSKESNSSASLRSKGIDQRLAKHPGDYGLYRICTAAADERYRVADSKKGH
jgi:hypothetical protein